MSDTVHKVTAFITREQNGTRELLVFQHPNAGIQLPAGTVEHGENIETAVVREAQEETGIQTFHLQTHLGGIKNELNEGECIITRTTQVFIEPSETAMPYERTLRRGITTQYHTSNNGWSHISYIEHDRVPNPRAIRFNITGWVQDDAISFDKPRHFYHLTTPDKTPDQWSTQSEIDLIFKPFWTPLSPKPSIISNQLVWLDAVYDQLRG